MSPRFFFFLGGAKKKKTLTHTHTQSNCRRCFSLFYLAAFFSDDSIRPFVFHFDGTLEEGAHLEGGEKRVMKPLGLSC